MIYYTIIDGFKKITEIKTPMILRKGETGKSFGISMIFNAIQNIVNIYFYDIFLPKPTAEEMEYKQKTDNLNQELKKIEKFLENL